MMHPDIVYAERFGKDYKKAEPKIIGKCEHCGLEIDDAHEYLKQGDILFCTIEHALEHNDIEIRS